ncbi:hypothetical protein KKA00_06500 [bacterium]|nr:hypothetical protein [bacterium]MBU1651851.1 hypothetical protein [bacterium]MBU1880627.1 hypothetical protein [bacterium]
MKRQNLIIMLIVIVALWTCGAIAKEIPNSEPNEQCIPGLTVLPGGKFDPIAPNEQWIPGLATLPGSKVDPVNPNEQYLPGLISHPGVITAPDQTPSDVPVPETEYAPINLQPQPTQPQLAPAPPLRGVTPIPPPQQGPGGSWSDRKKPSKWMWVAKMFDPGE